MVPVCEIPEIDYHGFNSSYIRLTTGVVELFFKIFKISPINTEIQHAYIIIKKRVKL